MPVEIRELIIKTEVKAMDSLPEHRRSDLDLDRLRRQLQKDISKMISEALKRKTRSR